MTYDLAVIGGGIVGTGIARDAALRGLKVALFEKDDFGAGTTSRSTRIVHGGLRYLEKLDLDLVYEALHERRRLLGNAPHLVAALPFLFPVYRRRGHNFFLLWTGIGIYDAMNPRRGMPHHRVLLTEQALRLEPSLRREGLKGGFLFYDAQCQYPERLCVENAMDAAAHGARVENHARVVGILQEGGEVHGVRVRRGRGGPEEMVEARLVVNASGPWLEEVDRLVHPQGPPLLRRSKGVHLVVPKVTHHALIMETHDARRVFFAIPWGDYTLLGTTDTDYHGPNESVAADEDDVAYLLREIREILEVDIRPDTIHYTTAGIRPLLRKAEGPTGDVTRKHRIVDHEATEGLRGLLTIVGGKITTFRHIAEEAVDVVFHKLGRAAPPSPTPRDPLPGGRIHDWKAFREAFGVEARAAGVPGPVVEHWLRVYGVRARGLLDRFTSIPASRKPLWPGSMYLQAELELSVEEEFCGSLGDFFLRRSMWGLEAGQGFAARKEVAARLGELLGWDARRREAEVLDYVATLERMRSGAIAAKR